MITTALPTTPTSLAWACVLAQAFEKKHHQTTRAMRCYAPGRPDIWSAASRAAFRYADHEIARRLHDRPHDPDGAERDQVDVTTAFFFLHCVHRDLLGRAAAELADIIDTICTDILTWDAVFPDGHLPGALETGLVASDQVGHASSWLHTLQKTRAWILFTGAAPLGPGLSEGPGPLAQEFSLRDVQALLVLAVLAVRALPDAERWIRRRQGRRHPRPAGTPAR